MSDEEDYMSETFMSTMEDVRPGISSSHSYNREIKITKGLHREPSRPEKTKTTKAQLEKERREEALRKPVSSESKGFALLSKMGYKPGMSLGKKKDEKDLGSGIKEPIPIEVKNCRTGLGHLAAEEEKSKARVEMAMKQMQDNARQNDVLIRDYRKRKLDHSSRNFLISDITKCRKACCDLDMRSELDVPTTSWFWKSYPKAISSVDDGDSDPELDAIIYNYANGKIAEEEPQWREFEDSELEDRLQEIVEYLRSTYFYCIWCGAQFTDADDLTSNCPGSTKPDHDDLDD